MQMRRGPETPCPVVHVEVVAVDSVTLVGVVVVDWAVVGSEEELVVDSVEVLEAAELAESLEEAG